MYMYIMLFPISMLFNFRDFNLSSEQKQISCVLAAASQTRYHTLTTECREQMVMEPEGQYHQHHIVNLHNNNTGRVAASINCRKSS